MNYNRAGIILAGIIALINILLLIFLFFWNAITEDYVSAFCLVAYIGFVVILQFAPTKRKE
jgi:hypothetical protein